MVVEGLAYGNLLVGVLNLVPGLPLDGGRVLKSAVWKLTGSVHRGIVVAAWGGRVTAFAVLLWPLAQRRSSASSRTSTTSCSPSSSASSCGTAPRPRSRRPRSGAGCRTWSRATWPAVPSRSPRTSRWPRRSAGPARRTPAHRDGDRRRPPVGVVNEAAADGHSGGPAALAGGLDGRPRGRPRPLAPGEHLGRGPGPRDHQGTGLEYLLVDDDGSIYGVLTTGDVDRAFRAAPD